MNERSQQKKEAIQFLEENMGEFPCNLDTEIKLSMV